MKLVFAVRSEKQFTRGMPWCHWIAERTDCDLLILIVGRDRRTLAEYVRKKIDDESFPASTKAETLLIGDETSEIREQLDDVTCKALILIRQGDGDDADFEEEVFKASSVPTILLRDRQLAPPKSSDQVHCVLRPNVMGTSLPWVREVLGYESSALSASAEELEDATWKLEPLLNSNKVQNGDLVIYGADGLFEDANSLKTGLPLLEEDVPVATALFHNGHSYVDAIAARILKWAANLAPKLDREQRTELANDLGLGSQPNLEFLGLMSAAAMLASFGLLQNSGAVVIGAMLIAPLMTPVLGAGLALAQGNRNLFRSALMTVAMGFLGALMSSMAFGWLCLLFDSMDLLFQRPTITEEMWARCKPSPLDFCVALVGGFAASYARTRRHLSSALAGAAIAAALVPPISTAGLQIAFGAWDAAGEKGIPIWGPLHLVAINVVTIMAASSFVLWARGMGTERQFSAKDRWSLRTGMLLVLIMLLLSWGLRGS